MFAVFVFVPGFTVFIFYIQVLLCLYFISRFYCVYILYPGFTLCVFVILVFTVFVILVPGTRGKFIYRTIDSISGSFM